MSKRKCSEAFGPESENREKSRNKTEEEFQTYFCPKALVLAEAFRNGDRFGWKLLDLPTACSFASVCKSLKGTAPDSKELRELCVCFAVSKIYGFETRARYLYLAECAFLDYPRLVEGALVIVLFSPFFIFFVDSFSRLFKSTPERYSHLGRTTIVGTTVGRSVGSRE